MGITPEIRYALLLISMVSLDTVIVFLIRGIWTIEGPIMRISPTLLSISDASKIPNVYHRQADKSKHFILGSFGKTEMVFNMQDWKQHAYHRKLIAGPVGYSIPPTCLAFLLFTSLSS